MNISILLICHLTNRNEQKKKHILILLTVGEVDVLTIYPDVLVGIFCSSIYATFFGTTCADILFD